MAALDMARHRGAGIHIPALMVVLMDTITTITPTVTHTRTRTRTRTLIPTLEI